MDLLEGAMDRSLECRWARGPGIKLRKSVMLPWAGVPASQENCTDFFIHYNKIFLPQAS